jgi:hypothetical protein
VPEVARLPASFAILHSFAIWAVAEPDPADPLLADPSQFETVSVKTAHKYLAAIQAWHLAQGWPPPLSDVDHIRIEWSLQGMANLQGASQTRPPCPPVTIPMLHALKRSLTLSDPFDACIWAMSTCAFFGTMRFGEVSVTSQAAFDGSRHLKRSDALLSVDENGRPYAQLCLPLAKTAEAGATQDVLLAEETDLCLLKALHNLATIVPACANQLLFSWQDAQGAMRPMVKLAALSCINTILSAHGWGNAFGHSFRIGGASFFLGKGVSPKIVRVHG